MALIIRKETPADRQAVFEVNAAAFETSSEADLVEALREQAQPAVSLVAELDGMVVGHILFSPVSTKHCSAPLIMGLGPMAVQPPRQNQGIGTALVHAGLDECRKLGARAVVVLGHPDYYPRFGFVPALRFGIRCEYVVPDEVFMVLELKPGGLSGVTGLVRYHEAFADAT